MVWRTDERTDGQSEEFTKDTKDGRNHPQITQSAQMETSGR